MYNSVVWTNAHSCAAITTVNFRAFLPPQKENPFLLAVSFHPPSLQSPETPGLLSVICLLGTVRVNRNTLSFVNIFDFAECFQSSWYSKFSVCNSCT